MAIQEVIKYEGDNSTLIYKHPAEDFNTLSQLIVHESQEAVFFSDGQALDSFKAGRYTLETKNIPLISKIRKRIVRSNEDAVLGRYAYHAQLYVLVELLQLLAVPGVLLLIKIGILRINGNEAVADIANVDQPVFCIHPGMGIGGPRVDLTADGCDTGCN